jgi:hypothetical protein
MKPSFKLPSEYEKSPETTPVSARMTVDDKKLLVKEADKAGMSLSELIGLVLKDYVAFLKDKKG